MHFGGGGGQTERGTGRLYEYEHECESCFSYLSHSGVGMSQLDHHGEVRGCELEETRGNHSLPSQSISTKALGAACETFRNIQSSDTPRNPHKDALTGGHPARSSNANASGFHRKLPPLKPVCLGHPPIGEMAEGSKLTGFTSWLV